MAPNPDATIVELATGEGSGLAILEQGAAAGIVFRCAFGGVAHDVVLPRATARKVAEQILARVAPNPTDPESGGATCATSELPTRQTEGALQ